LRRTFQDEGGEKVSKGVEKRFQKGWRKGFKRGGEKVSKGVEKKG